MFSVFKWTEEFIVKSQRDTKKSEWEFSHNVCGKKSFYSLLKNPLTHAIQGIRKSPFQRTSQRSQNQFFRKLAGSLDLSQWWEIFFNSAFK